jgi:hypothetical protein
VPTVLGGSTLGASAELPTPKGRQPSTRSNRLTRQPYRIWTALPLEYAARGPTATRGPVPVKRKRHSNKGGKWRSQSIVESRRESVTALRNPTRCASPDEETRRHNTTGGRRPRRDGGVQTPQRDGAARPMPGTTNSNKRQWLTRGLASRGVGGRFPSGSPLFPLRPCVWDNQTSCLGRSDISQTSDRGHWSADIRTSCQTSRHTSCQTSRQCLDVC